MFNYDWSSWTDWTNLSALDLKSVPTGPGAYVIATNRPLNRVISIDPIGMLTIGESSGLRKRFRGFRRCATRRHDEGHSAGYRYQFFRFDKHYPFETLRVRWIAAESKPEAYRIEGRFMLAYLDRHGELPPLNYSFNWSAFEELGWEIFDE